MPSWSVTSSNHGGSLGPGGGSGVRLPHATMTAAPVTATTVSTARPRTRREGRAKGVFGFVLVAACGWFGLYSLNHLRDQSPVPTPSAVTHPAPPGAPTPREPQPSALPPDARGLDVVAPAPVPGADDPDDEPQ